MTAKYLAKVTIDKIMKYPLLKLVSVVKRELLDASNRRERKQAEENLEYEQ